MQSAYMLLALSHVNNKYDKRCQVICVIMIKQRICKEKILFWQRNQSVTFDLALEQFKESHKKIMDVIQTMSNDELFQKNVYDWEMKKIKAHRKLLNVKYIY